MKGIFVTCTLKDEMSAIKTSLTVYLERDHIQMIFFPLVCFEIKSLRKYQGLFFKRELVINAVQNRSRIKAPPLVRNRLSES